MSLACLVVSLVIFLLAALIAFAAISSGVSLLGLLFLGLAFFVAGHLPI